MDALLFAHVLGALPSFVDDSRQTACPLHGHMGTHHGAFPRCFAHCTLYPLLVIARIKRARPSVMRSTLLAKLRVDAASAADGAVSDATTPARNGPYEEAHPTPPLCGLHSRLRTTPGAAAWDDRKR